MALFGNNQTVTTTFVGKDQLSPVVRSIRSTMDQFKRDASTGFGLAGGISVFNMATRTIGGVVDVLRNAVSMASDLQEANSKVGIVFEQQAGQIRQWATSAATNLGMAEGEALDAIGTFGNLLKGVGLTGQGLADMSRDVIQLATDLGSFNNVDTPQVLEDIRSGLVGEAEPMRKFGVLLNETAVKAKGMALGLANAKGEMSEASKVQARYALIMEQTTTAQGDFLRTSDSLANKQRIASAQLNTALTNLGTVVLPLVTDAVSALSDAIVEVSKTIQTFNDLFNPGEKEMREWILQVRAAGVGLKMTDDEIRNFLNSQKEMGNSIQSAIAELRAWEEMQRRYATTTKNSAFVLTDTWAPAIKKATAGGKGFLEVFQDWARGNAERAAAATERVSEAFGFVAENAGNATHNFKALRKQFRELMEGGDGNVKAIRRLTREIKFWERGYRAAVKNNDSEAASFARDQAERARAERRQRRLVVNAIKDEKQAAREKKRAVVLALDEEKRKHQQQIDILARVAARIRRAHELVEKFSTLPDAYWKAHVDVVFNDDIITESRRRGKGGRRASGGPVAAGGTYLVGEEGPELLTMGSQSGHITPNHAFGGDINLYVDGERLFRWMMRRQGREALLSPAG